MEYTNQIVLVTGSGHGIGKATALEFARQGATLVIADMDEEAANRTAAEIREIGQDAIAIRADVSVAGDVDQLFGEIRKSFGTLDVLVNNVGTTIRKPIIEFEEHEWDFVMDTNIKSMFMCVKHAGQFMLKKKSGAVVNISSIHGLGGISRRLPYATSKTAVDSFTKTLACEWAYDGVRVNAIAPGYILTEGIKFAFENKILSSEDIYRRTPLPRLGTPEDIANAAAFLCSKKASFITGIVMYVDGGYSAYHGPEAIPSQHHNLE